MPTVLPVRNVLFVPGAFGVPRAPGAPSVHDVPSVPRTTDAPIIQCLVFWCAWCA